MTVDRRASILANELSLLPPFSGTKQSPTSLRFTDPHNPVAKTKDSHGYRHGVYLSEDDVENVGRSAFLDDCDWAPARELLVSEELRSKFKAVLDDVTWNL